MFTYTVFNHLVPGNQSFIVRISFHGTYCRNFKYSSSQTLSVRTTIVSELFAVKNTGSLALHTIGTFPKSAGFIQPFQERAQNKKKKKEKKTLERNDPSKKNWEGEKCFPMTSKTEQIHFLTVQWRLEAVYW